MPNGGQVLVRLSFDEASQMLELVVRDSGSGMSPETLRRIFDPYFTTKSGPDETGKGGTGLGLSMCRNIIEAHQGRIRVESTPGRGTAFTLKLPVARQAAAAPIAPAPTTVPTTVARNPAIDA
jgi:signal transduction histidine kinase